jgi:hypothetical protein
VIGRAVAGLAGRFAEHCPPPPLRLRNAGPPCYRLGPGRQTAMETAPALAWFDLHAARLPLPVLRTARRALLLRQRQPAAREAKGPQLEAIRTHPALVVRASTPYLRSRAVDETMAMPTAPSLEGDTAVRRWAARDPLFNLGCDAPIIGADFVEALPLRRYSLAQSRWVLPPLVKRCYSPRWNSFSVARTWSGSRDWCKQ